MLFGVLAPVSLDVGFETVALARCEELPWEIRTPEAEIRRPKEEPEERE